MLESWVNTIRHQQYLFVFCGHNMIICIWVIFRLILRRKQKILHVSRYLLNILISIIQLPLSALYIRRPSYISPVFASGCCVRGCFSWRTRSLFFVFKPFNIWKWRTTLTSFHCLLSLHGCKKFLQSISGSPHY